MLFLLPSNAYLLKYQYSSSRGFLKFEIVDHSNIISLDKLFVSVLSVVQILYIFLTSYVYNNQLTEWSI